VIKPEDPTVNAGTGLELNCTLTKYNESQLDSSFMYFVLKRPGRPENQRVPMTYYSWPSNRTLRMIYPVFPMDHHGSQFHCYVNQSTINKTDVYIYQTEVHVRGKYSAIFGLFKGYIRAILGFSSSSSSLMMRLLKEYLFTNYEECWLALILNGTTILTQYVPKHPQDFISFLN